MHWLKFGRDVGDAHWPLAFLQVALSVVPLVEMYWHVRVYVLDDAADPMIYTRWLFDFLTTSMHWLKFGRDVGDAHWPLAFLQVALSVVPFTEMLVHVC